jgi:hypothetical protein
MIVKHEAAVGLLEAPRCGGFRNEPIVRRIIIAQLRGRWLRVQTDEAAITAFDDLENFRGGAIETVGGGKQNPRGAGAAGRAIGGRIAAR